MEEIDLYKVWFGGLFVLVLVWFGLCLKLFRILKTRHPNIYQSIGEPSFLNNTVSNNILLVKYLFKREWRAVDDAGLSKLSYFLLAYWCFYFLSFFGFMTAVFMGYAR